MATERWRETYDQWKLATPPEYEGEDVFDLEDDYGHDPDLDENGVCRVCGKYEPE